MKSMDLTVGDALYLYTICPILPDSSDFLLYKESLFLWLCMEPPRHAWRRPAIQQAEGGGPSATGKEGLRASSYRSIANLRPILRTYHTGNLA